MASVSTSVPQILAERKQKISAAYYRRMIDGDVFEKTDRIELVRGELIKMSPINTQHAAIVNKLNYLLNKSIDLNKHIIVVQNPVFLPPDSFPEPDLTISKFKPDFYSSEHPQPHEIEVIMEVADTSIQYDLQVKLPLYASAGIPVFIIFDIQSKRILLYKNPISGDYSEHRIIDGQSEKSAIEVLGVTLAFDFLFPPIQ